MRYAMHGCMLFMLVLLAGCLVRDVQPMSVASPTESQAESEAKVTSSHSNDKANDEADWDGPDLQNVTNYIFWCTYVYDRKMVTHNAINGIEGMSDHGHTHNLKAGGSISLYTGYTTLEDPRQFFLNGVRGCKKTEGSGLFQTLYLCKDEITGAIATDGAEYIVTYRKDPAQKDWRWDWDTFKLILETFRLIDGSEYRALFHAMYPGETILYEKEGPHGKVTVW